MKPAVEKLLAFPDMFAASHSADTVLSAAPRRLHIRGAAFCDFYPELILGVWERWKQFTQENSDVRSTTVIWDLTYSGKIEEVDPSETVIKTRGPHNWVAIQGRFVEKFAIEGQKHDVAHFTLLLQIYYGRLCGSYSSLH